MFHLDNHLTLQAQKPLPYVSLRLQMICSLLAKQTANVGSINSIALHHSSPGHVHYRHKASGQRRYL
mgnify:FL=1